MDENEILYNKYRIDGRELGEIRDLKIETGIVSNSSGSCSIEAGGTKILCWVNGPQENRNKTSNNQASIKCDFVVSQSSYQMLKQDIKRDLEMREFSSTLKEIFEEVVLTKLYPQSEIEINVCVLQNDGNHKSLSITTITVALIQAGIYICDTAVGVNFSLVNNQFLCDLNRDEEKLKNPIVNSCYLPNLKKIVFLEVTNSYDYSKNESIVSKIEKSADVIYSHIKHHLELMFRQSLNN